MKILVHIWALLGDGGAVHIWARWLLINLLEIFLPYSGWEVMSLFKEFHSKEVFMCCLSATFLALILKKGGVEDIRDFRPISVVGCHYSYRHINEKGVVNG